MEVGVEVWIKDNKGGRSWIPGTIVVKVSGNNIDSIYMQFKDDKCYNVVGNIET